MTETGRVEVVDICLTDGVGNVGNIQVGAILLNQATVSLQIM